MTRDEIRELAAFQADESKGACALSFYFQPDPPQDRSHRREAIVAKDVVIVGAAHLTGIDLSPAMIEKARARGIYDSLIVGDIETALIADVAIVAADQITDASAARDSIADIVMAYHDTTPLLSREVALLNPLIAGRVLTDVVIASWHRRHNPTGTHYSDLDPVYVRERVDLAAELLSSDFRL